MNYTATNDCLPDEEGNYPCEYGYDCHEITCPKRTVRYESMPTNYYRLSYAPELD